MHGYRLFCNDLTRIRELLRGLKFSLRVNDLCTAALSPPPLA
jgi:hypothetical protein